VILYIGKRVHRSVGDGPTAEECESCGSLDHDLIGTKRGWHLRQCKSCGLVAVKPLPDEDALRRIYQMSAGYYVTASRDLSATSPDAAIDLHRLLKGIGIKVGKLFDVGCSTGALIFHLRRFGWDVMGCDVNADAVAIARSSGLDVYHGSIDDVDCEQRHFDAVNMSDVLEHVKSPGRTLQRVHSLLNERGVLVLRIPNAGCGFARSTLFLSKITRLPWAQSEAPYHLFEYSHQSIKGILEKTGFHVETILFEGKSPFLYTIGGMGYFDELKREMKLSGEYKFSWHMIPYLPSLFFVSAILLPFWTYGRMIDRFQSSGSSMTIVARRKS